MSNSALHHHARHAFHGNSRFSDATLSDQNAIKDALTSLRRAIQKVAPSDAEVAIIADIRIGLSGTENEEMSYEVKIGNTKPLEAMPNYAANGDSNSPSHKRKRTDDEERPAWGRSRNSTDRRMSSDQQNTSVAGGPDNATMMKFLAEWRTQWVQQGGWMYDHLTTSKEDERRKKAWFQQQFETHAGVITSTLHAQHTQNTQYLTNISNGVQWLEGCRKIEHDSAQAREEKWRISSATFHDNARKDRETAEKELLSEVKAQQKQLDKQHAMIVQLMESQGLDLEEGND